MGTFVLDLLTPLGMAVWILYLCPLGLTYWLPHRRAPLIMASTCSVLVVVGLIFSPGRTSFVVMVALFNRLIGLCIFWITAILILQYKRVAEGQVKAQSLQAEILARQQNEEVLRKAAEEIRDLYENAPCGYHSLDKDGIFVAINDTELKWLGYNRNEVIGRMRYSDLLTADSSKRYQANFPVFKKRGWVRDLEFEMIRKDGTILPVLLNAIAINDTNGSYVSSRMTVFDITERKRAEEERDRFFTLSLDLLCIAGFDGYFKRLNPAWERTLGYTIQDLLAAPYLDFVHPDDRETTIAEAKKVAAGAKVLSFENRYRCKDGSYRSLQWTAVPDMDQQLTYAAARDITDRKQAEEALRRAHDGLEQRVQERTAEILQKTRDLETLLYVTSHDLREPLRSIENFSRMVHERYAKHIDEKGRDFLRRVVRGAKRMDRLLADILALSRVQRMESPNEEVEGESIAQEALLRLEGLIKESGAKVRVAKNLPQLQVNRTWATQGVYNLLANALKFTRDGEPPDIEIAPYEPGKDDPSTVGLVVRDRGPGVAPEHAERIFQLFQRAVGREVEGTGAGLAIVRQVAERHGGRAWVQPREGGGSEFVLTFGTGVHQKGIKP